jgi:hypothetical protein
MVKRDGAWVRVNDAFLPGNAKQVFQSTMPKTRGTQSWASEMKAMMVSDRAALRALAVERGWVKAVERMG